MQNASLASPSDSGEGSEQVGVEFMDVLGDPRFDSDEHKSRSKIKLSHFFGRSAKEDDNKSLGFTQPLLEIYTFWIDQVTRLISTGN